MGVRNLGLPMRDEPESKSDHRAAIALVAMLPLLYVLSIGPVFALDRRGVIPASSFLEKFYYPIDWLYRHETFRGPIDQYLKLWGVP